MPREYPTIHVRRQSIIELRYNHAAERFPNPNHCATADVRIRCRAEYGLKETILHGRAIPLMRGVLAVALLSLLGCSAPAATSPTATAMPPTIVATVPAATPLEHSTATSQRRPIVIDTDMAADDWMAILYLLQRPDAAVRAITVTGAGEAHCAAGVRNASGLAMLAGATDLPIACGRETPLQGNHAFPASWRAGVDSLLGLTLPAGPTVVSNPAAVELLSSVIQSSPEKVTVLTLGPLTNVAEALQQNPALVNNIEMIYSMGGAVTARGNVAEDAPSNTKAEWNIYVDPAAANIVLRSGAPVTLVPLDATNQVPLTTTFYERMARDHTTPEANFVFDILTKQKPFIESGGYFFWDPLAAAILTEPGIATFDHKPLCVVETEGSESGWTKSTAGCPEIRVAVSADGTRFEQLFLDVLNARAP